MLPAIIAGIEGGTGCHSYEWAIRTLGRMATVLDDLATCEAEGSCDLQSCDTFHAVLAERYAMLVDYHRQQAQQQDVAIA
jgi:hypothetical protein